MKLSFEMLSAAYRYLHSFFSCQAGCDWKFTGDC